MKQKLISIIHPCEFSHRRILCTYTSFSLVKAVINGDFRWLPSILVALLFPIFAADSLYI